MLRSVCGGEVIQLFRITRGGLHETYRVELRNASAPVVVRIARRPVAWFTDEAQLMAQAREVGVPTPEVLGVEHVDHEGELLSFSVLEYVPGHSLEELVNVLSTSELERLIVDAGELLARLHSVTPQGGMRHKLKPPGEDAVARAVHTARQASGQAAVAAVERGVALLGERIKSGAPRVVRLAHGDFLPKHLMIDNGAIVGVIDWEFAGLASPAFDIGRWDVSAGEPFHNRLDLLHRGYARSASLGADMTWVSAFAIDWALEVLGWKNPASPRRIQRCMDVISRHVS